MSNTEPLVSMEPLLKTNDVNIVCCRLQNWLIEEIGRHLTVFSSSMLSELDLRRTDVAGLSLWLAAHLPFDDELKLQLLAMQSPVKRLRCQLNFLTKVRSKIYLWFLTS